jgi:hypothetical protein
MRARRKHPAVTFLPRTVRVWSLSYGLYFSRIV